MNVEIYFNDNWDKIDNKMKELEEDALLDFESNGERITNYPKGGKGVFVREFRV